MKLRWKTYEIGIFEEEVALPGIFWNSKTKMQHKAIKKPTLQYFDDCLNDWVDVPEEPPIPFNKWYTKQNQ